MQAVREAIRRAREALLFCHVDPDGDAIGSLLGLGLALTPTGCRVTLVSPDGVPPNYAFLPGAEQVQRAAVPPETGSVVIVLDCGDLGRLGPAREAVARHPRIVNIDHHPTNDRFGTYNLVDPSAAATAELVLALLEELQLALTLPVATCLYTGLYTDTGGFRYENTRPRVHRAAERLLEVGVKPWEVADSVYNTKPLAQILLLREALGRLELSADGRIAWMSLPQDVLARCGIQETDGLIDYPRMIAGVEIAMLLRETEEGAVRVGFRSRRVDVSRLALRFGGGGHVRAAGCTVPGPLAAAEKAVLAAAAETLQEAVGNDGGIR
ncbi:MAG TPA: bifunctional oligoribonuclease/PAP phosphatase NrnA [Firmicutes bacterium]|nr:bifunctional oligoribonuclease/PAP phosphatase NrnA [Bacillota bacterium]